MMNENNELELKGIEAAKKYLIRRHGMEILNEEPFECEAGSIAVVARDAERGLVFVDVVVKDGGGFGPARCGEERRSRLEKIAAAFLAGYDEVDMPVCFDEMTIAVIDGSKALLRHWINCLSTED